MNESLTDPSLWDYLGWAIQLIIWWITSWALGID